MRRRTLRCTAVIACGLGAVISTHGLACGVVLPVPQLPDASIVVYESNGKSTVIPIDEKMAQALLNDPEAKPLDANVIVFKVKNATYVVKDHPTSTGEMMVASIMKHYVPPQGGG
jgi:hypothetical protein